MAPNHDLMLTDHYEPNAISRKAKLIHARAIAPQTVLNDGSHAVQNRQGSIGR
jgi:hypothetical protein